MTNKQCQVAKAWISRRLVVVANDKRASDITTTDQFISKLQMSPIDASQVIYWCDAGPRLACLLYNKGRLAGQSGYRSNQLINKLVINKLIIRDRKSIISMMRWRLSLGFLQLAELYAFQRLRRDLTKSEECLIWSQTACQACGVARRREMYAHITFKNALRFPSSLAGWQYSTTCAMDFLCDKCVAPNVQQIGMWWMKPSLMRHDG